MLPAKRAVGLGIAIAAVCALIVLVVSVLQPKNVRIRHLVCSQEKFVKVAAGMSKEDVSRLLGKPSRVLVNNGDASFMGLGPNSGIAEAWIFNSWVWSGGIEIYFDGDGRVKNKNCGYG